MGATRASYGLGHVPGRGRTPISLNAYELELSKIYKKLYRTFLVSLLKPYSRKKGEKPPRPIDLDKKDKF
jgi:hypothetical protein